MLEINIFSCRVELVKLLGKLLPGGVSQARVQQQCTTYTVVVCAAVCLKNQFAIMHLYDKGDFYEKQDLE